MWQPLQRIHVTLQLKSMDNAIHDSDIDPRRSMPQAQLVKDACIWVVLVT
jgi:hypothetical protein